MSDEASSPDGEPKSFARQSSVAQSEQPVKETSEDSCSTAEVVKLLDSLFPESENISIELISSAKNNLLRKRQVILQAAEKKKKEAGELVKQHSEAAKTARRMREQVSTTIKNRPTLDGSDLEKVTETLQSTSNDSRRAIYFITFWLIKRLDQKLEKLFALISPPKTLPASTNGGLIWDDRVALGTYLELLDVAKSIQSSACTNLVSAVTNATEHWFKQLLQKFSRDLTSKLDAIHYPFSAAMQPVPKNFTKSPLPLELEPLMEIVRLLLELRPPPSWKPDNESSSSAAVTFAASVVSADKSVDDSEKFGQILVAELTAPMSRRFRFHFYGKRPTNSPEHPEWYHTQILSWLESNGQFVRLLFSAACSTMEFEKPGDRVDQLYNSWASLLVRLAVEKLSIDLPALLDSDTIFAHLIDETLLFRQALFALLGKQNSFVDIDPLRLLLTSGVFDRWLDVEKRFALSRIDAFLSKSDALSISEKIIADSPPNGKEISIAPTCVIEFVSLVSGLLDRCEIIMSALSPDDQKPPPYCHFLLMVLGLVDGFRIRLLQLGRASDVLSSRGLALLAAAGHLEDALAVDWIHRPVVVASHAISVKSPMSSPKKEVSRSIGESLIIPPAKRMIEQISINQTLSASTPFDFTDEAALFARAVRELADDVVSALEMELTKACVSAADDHDKGEAGVDLPEEQSSHVVTTVAHCAAIALHNLLDRLRLGLGGSSALRRLVGSRLAARVDAVLFAQIFERLAARKAVLAQLIAKELDEFVRTRVVYLLARHLSPSTHPSADRLLPRVVDALHLLTIVQEPVARLLRSTLTSGGASQDEIATSLVEVGCLNFAKSQDGARVALLVLNIRFGASV